MHVKMYAFVTLIVLFGFGGPLIAAKKATLPILCFGMGGILMGRRTHRFLLRRSIAGR
jgi:hypothetical protein